MQYIAIEGVIGAGKTTLANLLSHQLGGRTLLEEFADNPFLPLFYQQPERYAFSLELSFLADRYQQLKNELLNAQLFEGLVISDYIFPKSLLFARLNLSGDELALFSKLYKIMQLQLPQPDLLIYIHSETATLQHNIKKRARAFEQNIKPEYLQALAEQYQQLISLQSRKTLVLHAPQFDLLKNESHLQSILEIINGSTQLSPDLPAHLILNN